MPHQGLHVERLGYFPYCARVLIWLFIVIKKKTFLVDQMQHSFELNAHIYEERIFQCKLSLVIIPRNIGICKSVHTEGACRLIRSGIHLVESGCNNCREKKKKAELKSGHRTLQS